MHSTRSLIIMTALALGLFVTGSLAMAAEHHTEYIEGPFKMGEEVTAACLECHENQAEAILETSHWKWKGRPNMVDGMENSRE